MLSENLNPWVENKNKGDHIGALRLENQAWKIWEAEENLMEDREGGRSRASSVGVWPVSEAGPYAENRPTLDLILCGCHIEILNTFWTGDPKFSFCIGSHKLYSQSWEGERKSEMGVGRQRGKDRAKGERKESNISKAPAICQMLCETIFHVYLLYSSWQTYAVGNIIPVWKCRFYMIQVW